MISQKRDNQIPDYYRKGFDTWLARLYDFSFFILTLGKAKKLRKAFVEKIPKDAEKILDMATGTGSVAIEIKNSLPSAQVIGIDLSNTMLSIAQNKAFKNNVNLALFQKDIEHTGFESDSFDAVTISFAMHELPVKIRVNVFKEAFRILKKGGAFIIMDLNKPDNLLLRILLHMHFEIFEPKYAWTVICEDFCKELKRVGFKNHCKLEYLYGVVQLCYSEK